MVCGVSEQILHGGTKGALSAAGGYIVYVVDRIMIMQCLPTLSLTHVPVHTAL